VPHGPPPLPHSPLFAGLADSELQAIAEQMRPRAFSAGEQICAAGEASDRLWLITGGLVHILAGRSDAAAGEVVARQRKGDVIGAQGAIAGEPRTATAVAAIPTSTLELDGERFVDMALRFPGILINLIRIQSERLVKANARVVEHRRGEAVALISSPAMADTVTRVVAVVRRGADGGG
jgi:CRP-like cAMP-binding protein